MLEGARKMDIDSDQEIDESGSSDRAELLYAALL